MCSRACFGALVLLAVVAAPLGAQQVPLGFVTGAARDSLVADWTDEPTTNERAYCVDADSTPHDWDSVYAVVYVTRLHRIHPRATPMSVAVDTLCHGHPVIHTHTGYCRVGPWGPEPSTCSSAVPEAFQCQPSFADLVLLYAGGEAYDVIQCGRVQFRFIWRDALPLLLGESTHATPHDSSAHRERPRPAGPRDRRPEPRHRPGRAVLPERPRG